MASVLFASFETFIDTCPFAKLSKQYTKKEIITNEELLHWNQSIGKNEICLPQDLLQFYSCFSNGISLQWDIVIMEHNVPIGMVYVNSIETLVPIAVEDLVFVKDNTIANDSPLCMLFDISDNRKVFAFDLDQTMLNGRVLLVNVRVKGRDCWSVWFQDLSCKCYFISHGFLNYFSLMLCHLGIPLWQYAFTPLGIPAASSHWMRIFAPDRLKMDMMLQKNRDHSETVKTEKVKKKVLDIQLIGAGAKTARNVSRSKPSEKSAPKNLPPRPQSAKSFTSKK